VTWVDWCDAKAFCTWAGKRLCRSVGGQGTAALAVAHDASRSEWLFACTRGSTRSYPYGTAYDPEACVGIDKGLEGLAEVGRYSSCSGGFDGIYDLSGNAHEWMDFCGPPIVGAETAHCSFSRSAWHVAALDMACNGIDDTRARDFREADIGFRCCSD
jgi:formylglycine-generating enzyme